jgi:Ni/Fe-hydrogenase b-type cytochrome subunit
MDTSPVPAGAPAGIPPDPAVVPGTAIRRHGLATRVWHWVNAIAVIVLLGSGLGISNAHPRLYWGQYGANFDTPWAQLPRFPDWITIPAGYNLAISRRWHLFFALVLGFGLLGYLIWGMIGRHFRRDLSLRRRELTLSHFWADVRAHWDFRFHDPARPRDYNFFQKLSYIGVLFVLLPLAILTGIALSPGMNAGWPWVLDLFGGRQSARSIHFVAAVAIGLFTVVHLVLVILAGAGNELRSMVTGWWRVPR